MKRQPHPQTDGTKQTGKVTHRRIGIDRREQNQYTDIIPERRSGNDRRKRKDSKTSGERKESDTPAEDQGGQSP